MDQLNVQVDGGVHVFGACPNRMDPTTSHVQAEDLEKIEIIKGPNAIRFGSAFGGLINLAMTRPQQADTLEMHTQFEGGYEGNTSGKKTRGYLFGSDRGYDFYLSGGLKDYGNYSDGSGDEIASSFSVKDYSLKLGWKPDPGQRLQLSARQSFVRDALYPALPMDADKDDTGIFALDYSYRFRQSRLGKLSAKAYLSAVDHVMSNQLKPTYAAVHAVTDAQTRTVGGRAELAVKAQGGTLFLGSDYYDLLVEGSRTRDLVSGANAGKHFDDIIWPDARSQNLGLFAEFDRPLSPRTAASFGLRLDRVTTRADRPENSFAALYPGDLERADLNLNASLSLFHSLSDQARLSSSLGLGRRSPSITERYLYLLPVGLDRYDYLGHPDVDPEQNLQLDLETSYQTELAYLNAAVFYSRLTDCISAKLDTSLPGRSPGVLGVKRFINIPRAFKYGGELEAGIRPVPAVLVRAQLSYALGEDDDSREPLPEMPPLEGTLAVRYDRDRFWVELADRFVARQGRISAEFGEEETPGFSVVNLTASARIPPYLRLSGGVNNIFDKTYYEHLNRRRRIDSLPINEAGRSFYLSMTIGK